MKVIGAGLPRTGTLTQKAALEQLGFAPCYHAVSVFADLAQARRWGLALEGELRAAEILEGHAATVDWPGAYHYMELLADFPHAKVLLSVVDGATWAQRMRETVWEALYGDGLLGHVCAARERIDPLWAEYSATLREMWLRSGLMNGRDTTDAWMAAAADRHTEEVTAYVRAEQLLVWAPEDGWEPLCAFLDVGVPDTPLAQLNDAYMHGELLIDAALDAVERHRAA